MSVSIENAIRSSVEGIRLPLNAWYEVAGVPTAEHACAAEALLSNAELHAYSRFHAPRRRQEFLAGRSAAKRAVARAIGQANADRVEIVKEVDGAPVVQQHPGIRVSISHSADVAIAMVARRPIGIDLEREEPRSLALTNWFFSDKELRLLATKRDGDWHALVSLLWTRKEAVSKVGRWGGTLPFRQLDCSETTMRVGDKRIRVQSARRCGYVVSLAYEQLPGEQHG